MCSLSLYLYIYIHTAYAWALPGPAMTTVRRIIIIIIRNKPLLKILNECTSLTGVGELNPH